ncbi:unnamed protein product [Meloidogyne enterolobii]|uniref:Uncharacterized protein n=1 Tax=Meloidogyne enterolobii TaxID=390850 RepID=A0ACB0ZBB9_MELEN
MGKPNSKKYLENIKIVDRGIERIVNLFENYFNDRRFFNLNNLNLFFRTVYLFTSDHGMTDWGSHGIKLYFFLIFILFFLLSLKH